MIQASIGPCRSMAAAPFLGLSPVPPHPTSARRRQSAKATDVALLFASVPSPLPPAPRSCARRAPSAHGNSRAAASLGRSVGMPDHADKPLDIRRKPRFARCHSRSHPTLAGSILDASQATTIARPPAPWRSDSWPRFYKSTRLHLNREIKRRTDMVDIFPSEAKASGWSSVLTLRLRYFYCYS